MVIHTQQGEEMSERVDVRFAIQHEHEYVCWWRHLAHVDSCILAWIIPVELDLWPITLGGGHRFRGGNFSITLLGCHEPNLLFLSPLAIIELYLSVA